MAQDPNRLDARVSVLENVTVQHTNTLGEHAHSLKETADLSLKTKDRLDYHITFIKGAMWVIVPLTTVITFMVVQAKSLIWNALTK